MMCIIATIFLVFSFQESAMSNESYLLLAIIQECYITKYKDENLQKPYWLPILHFPL